MNDMYLDYILEQAKHLLAIDSPSGYTKQAANYLITELERMGYQPTITKKGGVLVNLSNQVTEDAILFGAHIDTLGGMVAEIKENGCLRLTNIGGLNPNNIETETCKVITRFDGIYEGTMQLINASIHVNKEYDTTKRDYNNMEVLLDEKVSNEKETKALGIDIGDFVCFSPRTQITNQGFIKSRFLDDKLSAAILLGYANYLSNEKIVLSKSVYCYFTVYEEVGHGCVSSIPNNVTEIISVDMGCVGEGLSCDEYKVSICSKDSFGPYNYDIVTKLVSAAKKHQIDYALDVYPYYGSDAEAALTAGYEIKHGLIGPGVYASHGYERSHIDAVRNTYELIKAYTL